MGAPPPSQVDVTQGSGPVKLFARNATGLVREMGTWDVMVFNFGWVGAVFTAAFAFTVTQIFWAFPGTSFWLAMLLSGVFTFIGLVLVYSLLGSSLPRAGGDYVWITRALHPILGFGTSVMWFAVLAFFMGWGAYWGGPQAFATLFTDLGSAMHNTGLVHFGTSLVTKGNSFIAATALLCVFAVVGLGGVRTLLRVVQVIVLLSLIGAVVGLIVLATHNASEFRTSFNAFMHQFSNSPDYYGLVVRRARAAGYTQHFSLLQTVQAIPLVTFMVMAWGSTYLSGEIKQIQRSALRGMGFTLIALVVIETINYYLTARMVGTYFWGGISSQWLNGTLPSFPLSPYFNLFATVATGNSFSIVAINLSYALFTLVYIPLDYLVCSRLLFSWSFDRLLPERVTRVSDRTHSPTVAVIAVLVVAEIYLAIYVYTTWLTTFATIAATCLVLFLAALSALLLPVRMPTVYRVSPASRWRIGRVPVITIAGAVGVAFFGVLVYAFVSDDRYLANGKMSLLILLIEFLVGVAIYLTALVVRRRREGTDIRLAFREVPPE